MSQPEEVRELFRDYPFGTPATLESLQRAERELGELLSPILRELYLAFDGFEGPTRAQFFWPIFARAGLVEFNRFLRAGDEFPHEFVCSCVFFGDGGIGSMWGIKRDLPDSVILWDAEWGEDYEVVGRAPLDAWRQAKCDFDAIKLPIGRRPRRRVR